MIDLALDLSGRPDEWYDEARQPRCVACGRFAHKVRDHEGRFVHWALKCVGYDYWTGSWEHD